jgi:tRNA threonylcarbamoyladenosine biosynthesis protein TsaB
VPIPEGQGWIGAGSGWAEHAAALGERVGPRLDGTRPEHLANAFDVAFLAVAACERRAGVPAEQALPVYLRKQVTRNRGR